MFRKLTNESLWNTVQLKGVEKEELYWVAEAIKGMAGRENNDTHNILVLADWLVCYNRIGRVTLPFNVEGLLFRPGMPPERFRNNSAEGELLIIGYRSKKEES